MEKRYWRGDVGFLLRCDEVYYESVENKVNCRILELIVVFRMNFYCRGENFGWDDVDSNRKEDVFFFLEIRIFLVLFIGGV